MREYLRRLTAPKRSLLLRALMQRLTKDKKIIDELALLDLAIQAYGTESAQLEECRFIKAKQNLIFLGHPGTGKTHLATALGMQACTLGKKVLFKRMAALVEELTAAHEGGTLARFKRRYEACDLVIIDEWGYLPTNVTGTRLLFDLIADCYEKRSVILTTNLPIAEWNKIFCDEQLLMAIIDRLAHHGYLIKHTGESYRLLHSLIK